MAACWRLRRAATASCARRRGLQRCGSLPVCALGDDAVLKLSPAEGEHAAVEAACSPSSTRGCRRHAARARHWCTQDGWHYLLMSRLPGRRLVEVWPELDLGDRTRIAEQTGAAIAALHASMRRRWARSSRCMGMFAVRQRRTATERQRARGLAPQRLERIDAVPRRVGCPACAGAPRRCTGSCANT